MLYRRFAAVGFPALLLGMLAAERAATLLLGLYPASPSLWAASIELRSLCRMFSDWLSVASGGMLTIQFAILAAGMLLVCAMPVKSRLAVVPFLVNHLALLALTACTVVSSGANFAAAGPAEMVPFKVVQVHSLHLGWIHAAAFAAGLLGCAWCHYLFIERMREKSVAVSTRIRLLGLGL